jgi:hypothetical protein
LTWSNVRDWALLRHPLSLLSELNPFGPERLRAIIFWVVLWSLLWTSVKLSNLWIFEYAGLWSGDALIKIRPPEPARETGLILVTAVERKSLLGGVSPIPTTRLLQAVCGALKAKPRVLAVDLETSHVTFPVLKTAAKIVWARSIDIVRSRTSKGHDTIDVNPDYLLGKACLQTCSAAWQSRRSCMTGRCVTSHSVVNTRPVA